MCIHVRFGPLAHFCKYVQDLLSPFSFSLVIFPRLSAVLFSDHNDMRFFDFVCHFPRHCSDYLLDTAHSPHHPLPSTVLWNMSGKIKPFFLCSIHLTLHDIFACSHKGPYQRINPFPKNNLTKGLSFSRGIQHTPSSQGVTHGNIALLVNFCTKKMYGYKLINMLSTHRNLFCTLSCSCTRS